MSVVSKPRPFGYGPSHENLTHVLANGQDTVFRSWPPLGEMKSCAS